MRIIDLSRLVLPFTVLLMMTACGPEPESQSEASSALRESGASASYDVNAHYEFRKRLLESGPVFTGDTAWNVCEDKWNDWLPDCATDLDCQAFEEFDEGEGLVCWNQGCTPKGDYLVAREMCNRRWDRRDSRADPNFGSSYGLEVNMSSEGSGSTNALHHKKSTIKSVLDFTVHVLGYDVKMGEFHFQVKNTRGGAAEVSTWYEGLLGFKSNERSWTIDSEGGAREISAEKPKDLRRCRGINLILAGTEACAAVRVVFRMDATSESNTGAGLSLDAVPSLAAEVDVSLRAGAGIGSISTSVEGGGTLQLAALRFPLHASIGGRDGALKAGLVAQGLSGRVWKRVDGGAREDVWNFGEAPVEPIEVREYISPHNPLINLIWDDESVF